MRRWLLPAVIAVAPAAVSAQAEAGTITGVVVDAAGAGVVAAVGLGGTEYLVRSDSLGRFRIESIPSGDYVLVAQYPDLATFGLPGAERPIRIVGSDVVRSRLVLPPRSLQLTRLCGAVGTGTPDVRAGEPGDPESGSATVFGRVLDGTTGRPRPDARVWIGSAEWALATGEGDRATPPWSGMVVETDATGRFLACGLPSGLNVIAQASTTSTASDTAQRRVRANRPVLLEFHTRAGVELAPGFAAAAVPVDLDAVVDELVGAMSGRADEEGSGLVSLSGTVRSAEDDQPVAGARVRLLGSEKDHITGPDGAFIFSDLPRARYAVVTERLGLASDTAYVDLRFGSGTVASLLLQTRPVQLPELTVDIQRSYTSRRLAGFYRRMTRGLGNFITREDLDTSFDIIGAMRRVPGVRIDPCRGPSGLVSSDCYNVKVARGYSARLGSACSPLIYINGALRSSRFGVGRNAFSLLQSLHPDMIEGIEIYRTSGVIPGQYRMPGERCGAILVWLRGR